MFGIDDALFGSLIATGGSLVGGLLSNGQRSDSANAQMAFQAEQSSTAYQRAVKDLQAAGLNPMLAYSQGGASSGAGASYVADNVIGNAVNSGSDAYSKISGAKASQASARLIDEQAKTQEAQQASLRADAALKIAQARQAEVQTTSAYQSIDKGQLDIERLSQERPFWSSNAAADNMGKLIGLKQLEASFEETLQRIKNGTATEQQIKSTVDQIRLLIRKGELEIPGLQNEADFEKSVAGNPTKFLERFAPIMKALKFLMR